MNKIAWPELPLLDLRGRPADILSLFREKLLLIFLRHLA
jgi:hypothetical protein